MTWPSLTAAALLSLAGLAPADPPGDPEAVEPPVRYTLKVDGRPTAIKEGRPARIEGRFENPEIEVVAEPTRIFPHAGLRFEYLRHFQFEADLEDPEIRMWTLEGRQTVVQVFAFAEDVRARFLADQFAEQFGDPGFDPKPSTITLGGQESEGLKGPIRLGEQTTRLELYRLPSARGSKYLILQDTGDDPAAPSAEAAATLDLFRRTFSTKP